MNSTTRAPLSKISTANLVTGAKESPNEGPVQRQTMKEPLHVSDKTIQVFRTRSFKFFEQNLPIPYFLLSLSCVRVSERRYLGRLLINQFIAGGSQTLLHIFLFFNWFTWNGLQSNRWRQTSRELISFFCSISCCSLFQSTTFVTQRAALENSSKKS